MTTLSFLPAYSFNDYYHARGDDADRRFDDSTAVALPAPSHSVGPSRASDLMAPCMMAKNLATLLNRQAAEWRSRVKGFAIVSGVGIVGAAGSSARSKYQNSHGWNNSPLMSGIAALFGFGALIAKQRENHFRSEANRSARYYLLQCATEDYERSDITPELVRDFIENPKRFPMASFVATQTHPGWYAQPATSFEPTPISDPSAAFFVSLDWEENEYPPAKPAYRTHDPIIDAVPYVVGTLTVGAYLIGSILSLPASLEAAPAGVLMPTADPTLFPHHLDTVL